MPVQEGDSSKTMEFKHGSSVQEILEQFSVPLDQVKLIFINGVQGKLDHILKEGDRLGVFPAVAGG